MTIQDTPALASTATAEPEPTPSAFDVQKAALRGEISFRFRVLASGRCYRVEPARWPGQPRYWGFRVFRCKAGNMPDPTERSWLGAGGMTRAELPDAALAIRSDVDAWLDQEEQQDLRRWVLSN